jgi:hypothetical protein
MVFAMVFLEKSMPVNENEKTSLEDTEAHAFGTFFNAIRARTPRKEENGTRLMNDDRRLQIARDPALQAGKFSKSAL